MTLAGVGSLLRSAGLSARIEGDQLPTDGLTMTGSPLTAAAIAEHHPLLSPRDSLARGIALLRHLGAGAVPVAWEGRLVGMLVEADVLTGLAREGISPADTDPLAGARIEGRTVGEMMRPDGAALPGWADLQTAAAMMHTSGLSALPVVDSDGRYLGLLTRGGLLAALAGAATPRRIGGMATPLGVYLTTGSVRAGAGDLGLFLTGVSIMLLFSAAGIAFEAVAWAVQRSGLFPLLSLYLHPGLPPNVAYFGSSALWTAVLMGGLLALFLLFLRLAPLSATHAAEHQVVHAIEEGEELTLEKVNLCSRVHPRCGTNLTALLLILMGLAQYLLASREGVGGASMLVGLAAIALILLFRRRVGELMQRYVTTRPPSQRRLEKALAVGRELLAKHRASPNPTPSTWRRIWNLGMIQVLSGLVATHGTLDYLGPPLSRWLGLR